MMKIYQTVDKRLERTGEIAEGTWVSLTAPSPEEVRQDAEGLQIMRTLGNNMAWLLKSIEAGKKAGLEVPAQEEKIKTNFIR